MKLKCLTSRATKPLYTRLFSEAVSILPFWMMILLSLSIHCRAFSQVVGDDCDNAFVISELPYHSEQNMIDFGTDYYNYDVPEPGPGALLPFGFNASGITGHDVVYQYVADTTMYVEFELTGLQETFAIYVFKDCPFVYTMGYIQWSQDDFSLSNFQVLSGITYYIVISSSSFINNPFGFTMRRQNTTDCLVLDVNFGDACDDEVEATLIDRYRGDCTCEGYPSLLGSICENPIEIDTLPFITDGNLEDYGNFYSQSDIPAATWETIQSGSFNSSYINGNEAVFAYTPTSDQNIDIKMDRTNYVAFYVLTGCPFESKRAVFNPSANERFGHITEIPLTANTRYYIVVSTVDDYLFKPFHLEIRETGVFDCTVAQLNINGPCDDGDLMTYPDITDENCNCIGTPSSPGDICGNPLVINELPFHATDTTLNYGNNYIDEDFENFYGGPSASVNGYDVIYSYTPARDEILSFHMDHNGAGSIVVFEGCPIDTIIGRTQTIYYGDLEMDNVNLSAGQDYYFMISSNDYFNANLVYTLDIELTSAYCVDVGKYVHEPCDDGDASNIADVINYYCECEGVATIPGTICGNPLVISSLPFVTSDSTMLYGNHYSDSDFPLNPPQLIGTDLNGIYLDNNEAVYAYTPQVDEIVHISKTSFDIQTSLYVFAGCPFETTVALTEVVYGSSQSVLEFDSLYLSEGITYYIVLSASANPNTKYTLEIELVAAFCSNSGLAVGSPCDDGMPTTVNDTINYDCECVGTPALPGKFCHSPLHIESLPYMATGSINNYGDDYEPEDFPPIAIGAITDGDDPELYLNFDEVVYTYTPSEDQLLNITYSHPFDATGLYVFMGCPFDSTLGYTLQNDPAADAELSAFPVFADATYYIVIASAEYVSNQDFIFTIESENWDCFDLQLDFGESCDDGDPDTENDVITDDCMCAGTPIDYDCVNPDKYPIYNVSPDLNGEETTIIQCVRYGEYSQITNVYSGNAYAFAGVNDNAGELAFITVRRDSVNGPVLGTGTSPLIITTVSDADLFVHWNKSADCNATQSGFYCVNTSMICISCPAMIDCEGVINGDAFSGMPCDDNDPNTVRDTWNGDCECVGEVPIPTSICETAIPLACNGEPTTYQSLDGLEFYAADCFSGTNGFWFTFTGNGGNIDVNFPASFLANFSLFQGDCSALSPIDCFMYYEDIEAYQILNSVPGQSYYVYMSYASPLNITDGNVTMSISCESTLSGSVNENLNCTNRSATLFFYQPGTTTLVSQIATSIDNNGHFEIQNLPVGTFDIILDAHVSLSIGIPNYELSDGQNTLDFGPLRTGDITNDNAINIIDLSYVNLSFGKSVGDTFYDARADSNCDGIVNIVDLSIVNMSYLKTGAVAPLVGD